MKPSITIKHIRLDSYKIDPAFEGEFAQKLREGKAPFSYFINPRFQVNRTKDGTPVVYFKTYIGLLDQEQNRMIEASVGSEFLINNPKLVTNGVTRGGIATLASLYTLAQSHAAGILAYKLQELELGHLYPIGLVPADNFKNSIEQALRALHAVQPAAV